MRNIEIKARVADLEQVRRLALELGARDHGEERATDVYFRVPRGRLKLRVSNGVPSGTLIAYQRPDQSESRVSDYRLISVPDAQSLHEALAETLGVLTTVRKTRRLLLYGATRIHLDEVEDLGTFVELETVLEHQSLVEAEDEHRFLRERLGLDTTEIVPVSYSDLLTPRSG
jgi:predicted adenylyl cyclase CyaB